MLDLLRRNTAPPPSRILRPGVRTLPERVERYPVPGAGSVVVEVKAGDAAAAHRRRGRPGLRSAVLRGWWRFRRRRARHRADGTGEGLKAILSRNGGGRRAHAWRTSPPRHRPRQGRSAGLFGAESRPGSHAELKVARDGLLIVAAPGAEMAPDAQDTATDIELRITRAHRPRASSSTSCPSRWPTPSTTSASRPPRPRPIW